ncbi:MAG: diaminopimelate epimerase, partial [Chloroflexota bacterium]|nr:diaminopimelate epimerase [Chloroflexota bacterium]
SSSYTKPGRSAEPLPPVIKMTVETLSGMRRIRACMSAGKINQVEVSMGMPRFLADQIPITLSQPTSIQAQEPRGDRIQQPQPPFLNYPVEIKGQSLKLFLVSMGNPHAVSFIDAPVADFPLAELGPQVERHLLFPKRTNFEVARVLSRGEIEARVWERGVGETLACGSGACAIAVAAQLLGHVDREVDIILPGGTLSLAWDRTGEVVLSGPVEEVFIGEYPTREGD